MTFAFTTIRLCMPRQFQRQRPNTARKIIKRVNGAAHVYEVRPRKDHRGVNLVSDALPFGALWYGEPMQSRTQPATQSFTAVHMML